VIGHLLARADRPPVVALARRPGAAPDLAALTVRFADYDDRSSLRDALAEVRTLVFVSSDGVAERMRRHHHQVFAAALGVGVDTSSTPASSTSRRTRVSTTPAVHRETEMLIRESGLRHCIARTSIFADFFVSTWIAPALSGGTLALPAGDGRMSLLSRDDAARALAVAAITHREGIIDLTGPAALTAGEISHITEAASRSRTRPTGRRLRPIGRPTG
jgi:NAD(P)H dehydrogenase (quinone)